MRLAAEAGAEEAEAAGNEQVSLDVVFADKRSGSAGYNGRAAACDREPGGVERQTAGKPGRTQSQSRT